MGGTLKRQRVAAAARADTAVATLATFADQVVHLVNGIRHLRDEHDAGRPPADTATLRRAARLVAGVCYELDEDQR